MARRKLWNWWTAKGHGRLHGFFAAVFFFSWSAGSLPIPCASALKYAGGIGFFLLMLLLFLHQSTAGTRQFLNRFCETNRLPSRQIQQISAACMILFLIFGAAVMIVCSLLLTALWSWIADGLSSRPLPPIDSQPLPLPSAPMPSAPDLSASLSSAQPSQWVRLADRILSYFGVFVLLLLAFALLIAFLRRLWGFLTRPKNWDEDERISIRPARFHKNPSSGISLPLNSFFLPDEAIRRIYRRKILNGLRRHKKPARPWMSPQELEQQAQINDTTLHHTYESARYGKCTAHRRKKK